MNLSPVAESRGLRLAACLGLVLLAPVAVHAEPLAELLACRDLGDDAARLACFDRASASLSPRAAAPTPALAPQDKFGLTPSAIAAKQPAEARPVEVAAIQGRLAAIAHGADGRLTLTLDNGQVWRQLQPGDSLPVKVGDALQVSRGALGSFWLRTPSGRGCKVNRIR